MSTLLSVDNKNAHTSVELNTGFSTALKKRVIKITQKILKNH